MEMNETLQWLSDNWVYLVGALHFIGGVTLLRAQRNNPNFFQGSVRYILLVLLWPAYAAYNALVKQENSWKPQDQEEHFSVNQEILFSYPQKSNTHFHRAPVNGQSNDAVLDAVNEIHSKKLGAEGMYTLYTPYKSEK